MRFIYVFFSNNLCLLFVCENSEFWTMYRPLRQNPPGNLSGRQLGEAAHRLVINSLQVGFDRNDSVPRNAPPLLPYNMAVANGIAHPNGQLYPVDHRSQQWPEHPHAHSQFYRPRDQSYNGPNQWNSSSVPVHHHYERSAPSTYERDHHHHHHSHNGRGSYPNSRSRVSVQSYHHQDGSGCSYPPANQPVAPPPVARGPYGQTAPSYNGGYGGYHQSFGPQQWGQPYNNNSNNGRGPQFSQSHQQSTNRYNALDRGSNRRPPPQSGHGRYQGR